MFKVINPLYKEAKNFTDPAFIVCEEKPKHVIFLAGPCPRTDYTDDWRFEAIKYLEEAGFDGIVFNPTNPEYNTDDPTYLEKQTKWEQSAMHQSDKIVFWIARDENHPALTTNIELGQFLWPNKIENIIIGMPDWATKNNYIKIRLKMLKKDYDTDLKTLMYHVVDEGAKYDR